MIRLQHLGRNQDKLKRRLREYSNKQDELDDVKKQLSHLQNVQVIVEGKPIKSYDPPLFSNHTINC